MPIHYAVQKCANWRELFLNTFPGSGSEDILRSFRIPIEDIRNLAAIDEAVAVRAYLAADAPDNPGSLKLMIVPIVADTAVPDGEKDILHGADGAPDSTYIFDLTQPCPVLCDKASVLYGPQEPAKAEE